MKVGTKVKVVIRNLVSPDTYESATVCRDAHRKSNPDGFVLVRFDKDRARLRVHQSNMERF